MCRHFVVDDLNNFCQVWTAVIVHRHCHALCLSGEEACYKMQRALFSSQAQLQFVYWLLHDVGQITYL